MNKKMAVRIISVLCVLFILSYNLAKLAESKKDTSDGANIDLSEIEEIGNKNIADVQKNIDEGKTEKNASDGLTENTSGLISNPSQYSADEILQKVQNSETDYSKIFQDTLIVGDSLVEALSLYNILNSENTMGKVNASLYVLDSLSDSIIAYHPKTLILHYGENHVGGSSQEYIDNFITFYTSLIKNFQEKIPDTRIVVSSIFLPSEQGLATSPHLKSVPLFNEGLEKMCRELGVEYLDNSSLFSGDNSFYEPDGVHLKKMFYTDYWLPFMAHELNLI